MCDYSLGNIPNRLAVENEQLVVHRFLTGAKGLTSPAELPAPTEKRRFASWWSEVWSAKPAERCPTAVCIPPGARLLLRDIPVTFQRRFGVRRDEEVTFTQLSAREYEYRDAIRFNTGREIALQALPEGLRVDVLTMGSEGAPSDPVENTPRRFEEYERLFAR